mgnify:CR=1 FL=1
MLKITETYVDFNGVERKEDFYFNLTQAELMDMELGLDESMIGSMSSVLKKIVAAKDTRSIMKIFKQLVSKAYGVKTEDGKRFVKNDEVRAAFEQHPAYSQIYMRLATNDKEASDFVLGILPKDISEKVQKEDLKAFMDNDQKAIGQN